MIFINIDRPDGKESTEVRKSQIRGKESENSYQELKRSLKDRHTQTHGNCIESYSLPIDKDGHACQNISIQFPCVCVCLSFSDIINSW
jgi:hypothetical protein